MTNGRAVPGVVGDPLIVMVAGVLAYLLRYGGSHWDTNYLFAMALGALGTPAALYCAGAYTHQATMGRAAEGLSVIGGVLLLALTFSVLSVLTKTSADFSRVWMLMWILLATAGLLARRRRSRAQQWSVKRVLLCAPVPPADPFLVNVAGDASAPDVEVLVTGDASDKPLADTAAAPRDDWQTYLAEHSHRFDEIWLLGTGEESRDLLPTILRLTATPVRYHFAPPISDLLRHPLQITPAGVSVELHASPLDAHGRILKSLLDRCLATVGVLVLLPLLLVISGLILLDSGGPIFFYQRRHGLHGREFSMLKFRTMMPDSDNGIQATAGDLRTTRVGRVLRRSSLDELPQLLHVITGQMSLVGPRPHPVSLNHQFMHDVSALMQRHKVKPGITGWAQINGLRGATQTPDDMAARIDHDIYYIEHWSLWLDLKILALTLIRGWTGEHAY